MYTEDELNRINIKRELEELPPEELQTMLDFSWIHNKRDKVVLAELNLEIYGSNVAHAWAELGRTIAEYWEVLPAAVTHGTFVYMAAKEIKRDRTPAELLDQLVSDISLKRWSANDKEKREAEKALEESSSDLSWAKETKEKKEAKTALELEARLEDIGQ